MNHLIFTDGSIFPNFAIYKRINPQAIVCQEFETENIITYYIAVMSSTVIPYFIAISLIKTLIIMESNAIAI